MEQSNHGSHAKVGDLVELLNPSGHRTKIFALVTETCATRADVFGAKYLLLHVCKDSLKRQGPPIERWKANFCRIISRA